MPQNVTCVCSIYHVVTILSIVIINLIPVVIPILVHFYHLLLIASLGASNMLSLMPLVHWFFGEEVVQANNHQEALIYASVETYSS